MLRFIKEFFRDRVENLCYQISLVVESRLYKIIGTLTTRDLD